MTPAKKAAKKDSERPFEERLASLEELVDNLASGELSLEEGVDLFKEGVELIKGLQGSLKGAEKKVTLLAEELAAGLEELEGVGEDGDDDA